MEVYLQYYPEQKERYTKKNVEGRSTGSSGEKSNKMGRSKRSGERQKEMEGNVGKIAEKLNTERYKSSNLSK